MMILHIALAVLALTTTVNCQMCPRNCVQCNIDKTNCTKCSDGFYNGHLYDDRRYNFTSNCSLRCDSNCDACNSYANCTKCKAGYCNTGNYRNCRNKCYINCQTCSSCNICKTCKAGYYGTSCKTLCGYGCLNRTCDIMNGFCDCDKNFKDNRCGQCITGKYGPRCQYECPKGCLHNNCDSKGLCLHGCKKGYSSPFCNSCIDGFYGNECEACPKNCMTCLSTKQCSFCKDGFYGDQCETQCSRQCKGSCKQFLGECYNCIDGYFGNYCDENCPKDCIKCTSNIECTLCKRGKKGISCQEECSNCKSGTQCRKSDGYCIDACANGFYGPNCDRSCAVQCKTCHRDSYNWCLSCKYGTYNYLTCHLDCSETCLNKSCDEQNGHCSSGCKTGYWGMKCEKACPKNCHNAICSMQNGSCLEGCVDGFYGDTCSYMCSKYDKHCQKCSSVASNQYKECKICNAGHFPSNDSDNSYKRCIPCPLECNETSCSSETGLCLHGCRNGYWGETCKRLCTSACSVCNQRDGICLHCISGYYGDDCSQNCSSDCVGKCEKNSGKCVIGCARQSRYGSFCDKDCSSNCVNKECNWTTGHCTLACVDGYFGSTCNIPCSKHCRNHLCRRDSGECNIGCIEGYEGPQCTQEASGSGNSDIILILSIVTGVFAMVAGCVLVVVLYLRHQKSRKKEKHKEDNAEMQARTDNDSFVDEPENDRDDVETGDFEAARSSKEVPDAKNNFWSLDYVGFDEYDDVDDDDETNVMGAVSIQENTYYNAATVLRRRIELGKLQEFVSKKSKDDFLAEFQELPVGLIKSYEVSQKMENRAKNRYRGLYPYDGRRVIIKHGGSDYINASYIDGYMKRNAYIASTGPTVKHMGEDFAIFWEMVWQEHVTKIIMLTNLVELGVTKCDQYWPGEGSCCTYGQVVVTCRKESIQKNFTVRTFDIKRQSEQRTLCQMHFTSWPDKGMPASVGLFTEFHNIANDESIAQATAYPILVHCSAGVGRTGSYIALDILTNEGRAEGHVDIFACVRNLREERVNMVQTLEQYVYIHKCLVENLTPSGFTPKQITANVTK